MKKTVIAFLLITSVITAQKQQYKHSLKGIKKVSITSGATVKVVAKSSRKLILTNLAKTGNTLNDYFTTNYNDSRKKAKIDKKKGLTPIYAGGKDNTNGFGFSVSKKGAVLIIKDLKPHFQRGGIQAILPKNIDVTVNGKQLGNVYVEGFSSEVEIETKVGKINVKNITGPITAHSSVGNISIDFYTVNQTSPITVSSSVSEIDITLPSKTKANLDMKTNGTVYTNFDLKVPSKDGQKNISNKKIVGTINNGGVKIKLKSSIGNIYLRKK